MDIFWIYEDYDDIYDYCDNFFHFGDNWYNIMEKSGFDMECKKPGVKTGKSNMTEEFWIDQCEDEHDKYDFDDNSLNSTNSRCKDMEKYRVDTGCEYYRGTSDKIYIGEEFWMDQYEDDHDKYDYDVTSLSGVTIKRCKDMEKEKFEETCENNRLTPEKPNFSLGKESWMDVFEHEPEIHDCNNSHFKLEGRCLNGMEELKCCASVPYEHEIVITNTQIRKYMSLSDSRSSSKNVSRFHGTNTTSQKCHYVSEIKVCIEKWFLL